MHRGNSDAQRPGAAQGQPGNTDALLPSSGSSARAYSQPQGSGNFVSAQNSNTLPSAIDHEQPAPYSQPVMHSSDSTGSLPMAMDSLEGRSSGQMPMRAGSPALGGRAFPKPPSWSSQMHDPFGDLVTKDLKRVSSNQSNTS